ncbi:hypothetical protein COT27_01690 [Candidatus Kuenenbacteria bacterium CG08_land_8_20_14_0_20_37_23]|uniref:Glycosyl transferase family 1 domain-containing protein n=2 Tax=Candidatus Kueneniibacteriota TaxID=1752740 RepID=A0A2M6XSV3_9BACT|nr:MAG: hypothetical protein AUJ29_01945 [Candidatus Kuenenbacteria bacterium CG1_02_38_13]PIU10725.1 MAG: hypothetical protein COT27_01690 [Candidatus Kuenenbacteria bacterium CG08_land_8_20_14_0_20_37_23]
MIYASLLSLYKKYSQFLKYCVGGGTAFVVDFSLLYFLTDIIGIWYLWSATLSFVIAAFVNYLIQKFWTFKVTHKKTNRISKQFFAFLAVQIVGLFINNTAIYALVDQLDIYYLVAKIIAAAIVLIWNFWASKKFVFHQTNEKSEMILAAEIFPPDIGGPATYTYRLAEYLLKRKYKLKIICYSTVLPAQSKEEFGKRITRISSFISLSVKYFLYFFKLLNMALHTRVIYAQGPVAAGLPAMLASIILRKKLVIKVVGDYAWEQAQTLGATRKSIDEWQKYPKSDAPRKSTNLKIKFLNFIEKTTVKKAAAIIVPSQYLKRIVMGWEVPESKIKVIYNSVEFDKQKILSKAEAQKKIGVQGDLIIMVARLVPWKGIDFLISLMPELKKINPNFKLLILGSGKEEGNLKKLIVSLRLEKDVIMPGRIDNSEMFSYYSAASIFVLNSSYEGLSHVILDAMYYRLPIIVTDVGGNGELILDDYNGLLVGYNDKEGWLKAINRLWFDKNLSKRLCSAPLVKMDIFSFERMIKETMKVLEC